MKALNSLLTLSLVLIFSGAGLAEEAAPVAGSDIKVIDQAGSGTAQAEPENKLTYAGPAAQNSPANFADPVKYTLGPDDVVEVMVLRHPEFSGVYPVNLEGKIQYKFVGDIDVSGLTKAGLEEKLKQVISKFVISPELNVTIVEYKSKVIYVLGEVGSPGKYYMRSEAIPVREAVVQAGLPTLAAAMRRCRIVTPDKDGKAKTKNVDLYSLLYGGNLKQNIEMHPGDVLYVPATIMAKIVRIVNPITAPIASLNSGDSSATQLMTR